MNTSTDLVINEYSRISGHNKFFFDLIRYKKIIGLIQQKLELYTIQNEPWDLIVNEYHRLKHSIYVNFEPLDIYMSINIKLFKREELIIFSRLYNHAKELYELDLRIESDGSLDDIDVIAHILILLDLITVDIQRLEKVYIELSKEKGWILGLN